MTSNNASGVCINAMTGSKQKDAIKGKRKSGNVLRGGVTNKSCAPDVQQFFETAQNQLTQQPIQLISQADIMSEAVKLKFKKYLKYSFHDLRARESGLTKLEISSFLFLQVRIDVCCHPRSYHSLIHFKSVYQALLNLVHARVKFLFAPRKKIAFFDIVYPEQEQRGPQ
ncbi:hypothetical protein FGO68_gene566 [Halteria grandinella]|uniref:Uncharacterized protein n=1 Tax=Halteria grandinella TaxID=5974 RepID=A0A8J8T8T1_HALGN|nr:hypothetical protein FGO68_gene566 [Halteria grandinella]